MNFIIVFLTNLYEIYDKMFPDGVIFLIEILIPDKFTVI
jgi:hypothetical protein